MKAGRAMSYNGTQTPIEAVRALVRVRFAETLERSGALMRDDDEAIHAFRLACKRLRFALERSADQLPLSAAAGVLSAISDELGSAHDCVVLAQRARDCNAPAVVRLALIDREKQIRRARRTWRSGFGRNGAFAELAAFTRFSWDGDAAR